MPHIGFYDKRKAPVRFTELASLYRPENWTFPLPVLQALAGKERDRNGSVGVTELSGEHRQAILRRRKEYFSEPDDELWKAVGIGLHHALEQGGKEGHHELHLVAEVEGIKVEGHVDYTPTSNEVLDWKTTSVFKTKKILQNGCAKEAPDWFTQLSLYKALASLNGMNWTKAGLFIFSKDWRAAESKREHGYPPAAVAVDVELPSTESCVEALKALVRAWKVAMDLPDEALPECHDLWGKNDQWLPRRCADYCAVNEFCSQFAAAKNARRR